MGFELNQILAFEFRSPGVSIGDDMEFSDNQIEIFDPELALIGKLDKIPIMRALAIIMTAVPDVYNNLVADTGNGELKYLVQLFNDNEYPNPENPGAAYDWNGKHPNLIGVASLYFNVDSTTKAPSYFASNFSMQFQGGIPLKPKLLFRNELGFINNVGGSDWPSGGAAHGKVFIEIDWAPVSAKEFNEYLKEYIYVQD